MKKTQTADITELVMVPPNKFDNSFFSIPSNMLMMITWRETSLFVEHSLNIATIRKRLSSSLDIKQGWFWSRWSNRVLDEITMILTATGWSRGTDSQSLDMGMK